MHYDVGPYCFTLKEFSVSFTYVSLILLFHKYMFFQAPIFDLYFVRVAFRAKSKKKRIKIVYYLLLAVVAGITMVAL